MMKEVDMAELAGLKRDANQLPPFWREVSPFLYFIGYCSRTLEEIDMAELAGVKRDSNHF